MIPQTTPYDPKVVLELKVWKTDSLYWKYS